MIKIFLILFFTVSVWANIGSVTAVKGEAQVKRIDKLLNVTSGMDLLESDEIITQAKARVQVILVDNTVITIGANSSFSFDEFSFDGGENSKVTMRANRGFFRALTGAIGKIKPDRFKLKTKTATIGIRGTDFSGDIAEAKEIIKCFSGTIFVDHEGISRDVDAGMMIEITEFKVEVKEIAVSKVKESSPQSKKVVKKQAVKKELIESVKAVAPTAIEAIEEILELDVENVNVVIEEIATELITEELIDKILDDDIIDVIDDVIDDVITDIITEQPFEVSPELQDREVEY